MTNYKELVKQAAERYGFNLEFRTKEVFEKNHYLVDLNLPLSDGIEVDVKASKYQHMQILAECKGTAPSSYLILPFAQIFMRIHCIRSPSSYFNNFIIFLCVIDI